MPHAPRKWKLHQEFEQNAPSRASHAGSAMGDARDAGNSSADFAIGVWGIAVEILGFCPPAYTFIQQEDVLPLLDVSLQPSKVVDYLGLRISQTWVPIPALPVAF